MFFLFEVYINFDLSLLLLVFLLMILLKFLVLHIIFFFKIEWFLVSGVEKLSFLSFFLNLINPFLFH